MTRDSGVAAAAIVLAGGRGSRLGGVRKADLVVGGRRLLDVVLDACVGCDPVVVVGHEDLAVPPGVIVTRESPPYAGPAAALGAGLDAIDLSASQGADVPDWVLCLGCDQPGVADAVPALRRAAAEVADDVDAITACASVSPSLAAHPDQLREITRVERAESPEVRRGGGDSAHRIEWVLSILRTDALARTIAAQDDGLVDCSMRRLLGALRWSYTPVPASTIDDIDTWEDHARWEQRVGPA